MVSLLALLASVNSHELPVGTDLSRPLGLYNREEDVINRSLHLPSCVNDDKRY